LTRIRLLLASILLHAFAHAQPVSCLSADAGYGDTLCQGQCANLLSTVDATRHTTSYNVTTISYAPFSFTGGTPVLVNLDDVWSTAITIPFCFEFYGTVYNQVIIGTNGVVSFDVSQASGNCPWTINTPAPNPNLPLNCIMAPFHDIDPSAVSPNGNTSINWAVYGAPPCRKFVINWNDVVMYGNGCDSLTSTSQVVLHETSYLVDIFIQDKLVCNSWNNGAAIEGLHDATGSQATIAAGRNYPVLWSAQNDGQRFIPTGAPAFTLQWLDPLGNSVGTSMIQAVCPTQTTTYTLQVSNTACSGPPIVLTDTVTIVVVQSNLTVTDSIVNPECYGTCDGMVFAFATNGIQPYTYSWSPNTSITGTVAANLCTGIYMCTVTDASGCSVSISANLTSPTPLTVNVSSTPTICSGATGTASANIIGGNGPFTYQWNTGDTTQTITGLPAGSYMVIVFDSAGCADTLAANVWMNGLLLSATQTGLLCNGDCNATATVTPASGIGPYFFTWSPYGGYDSTATGLCAGVFNCLVTDSIGCQSTYMVSIASPPPIVLVPSSNITVCQGQSTYITAGATGGTAPYSYSWSHGLPNSATNLISPSTTTVYTVVVTDANGCSSAEQTTLVKVIDLPDAVFSNSAGYCPPAIIYFTNGTDSVVSWEWNFGDPASGGYDTSTLENPAHMYASGGNYSVTLIVTNAYGCRDTLVQPAAVYVPPAPDANLTADAQFLTTLDPATVFNNLTTGGTAYVIYYGDGDSLATAGTGPYPHAYDSIGIYEVMLIAWNNTGCMDTTWLTLVIEEASTCFIPNAFTPNNSGVNDLFMVYGENVDEFELMIFDRWGMLLYTTNDINQGWDGTYNGTKCEEDVYVWRLKYLDNSGNRHERVGHVSLIR
jgi:gliding motility-associated-like protein